MALSRGLQSSAQPIRAVRQKYRRLGILELRLEPPKMDLVLSHRASMSNSKLQRMLLSRTIRGFSFAFSKDKRHYKILLLQEAGCFQVERPKPFLTITRTQH